MTSIQDWHRCIFDLRRKEYIMHAQRQNRIYFLFLTSVDTIR